MHILWSPANGMSSPRMRILTNGHNSNTTYLRKIQIPVTGYFTFLSQARVLLRNTIQVEGSTRMELDVNIIAFYWRSLLFENCSHLGSLWSPSEVCSTQAISPWIPFWGILPSNNFGCEVQYSAGASRCWPATLISFPGCSSSLPLLIPLYSSPASFFLSSSPSNNSLPFLSPSPLALPWASILILAPHTAPPLTIPPLPDWASFMKPGQPSAVAAAG